MKKQITLVILFIAVFSSNIDAQNLPDWVTSGLFTGTVVNTIPGTVTNPVPLPAAYNSAGTPTTFNYVRSWYPLTRTTNDVGITVSSDPLYFPMTTAYSDGFGRNLETISRSNNTLDSSTITFSDNRPSTHPYSFLSYAVAGDARFQMNPFLDQRTFYNNRFPNEPGCAASENLIYSDANSRSTTRYAAGKSNIGQTRGTSTTLSTNAAGEVQKWGINVVAPNWPQMNGIYPAGLLVKKTIQNADGAQTQQFYDLDNKLICSKVMTAVNQYNVTYYVYDVYDRLAYALTPKAIQYLASTSWAPNSTIVSNLCFHKLYDTKGRLIQSHTAGETGDEYYVYDTHNRLALSQSPKLAATGQWGFTLYDPLDRPTITGQVNNSWPQSFFQLMVDNGTDPAFSGVPGLGYYMTNASVEGTYPSSIRYSQINTNNYYDNYSFLSAYPSLTGFSASPFSSFISSLYSIAPVQATSTKGFLMGTVNRVLKPAGFAITGINDWLVNANYYDDYNKVLQTQSINHRNGVDITSYQFDFRGNKLAEVYNHHNPACPTAPGTTVVNTYMPYSYTNKPHTITSVINGAGAPQVASYTYNSLGQVNHKVLGSVEDQVYNYNLRGQLTGINADYAELGNADGNMVSFGESIKYDCGFTSHLYGGNISGIYWKGAGSARQKTYAYTYDNASRLISAPYLELKNAPYYSLPGGGTGGGPVWTNADNDFSELNISYDVNGNIKTLSRFGPLSPSTHGLIDKLSYTYANSDQSNLLQSVNDAVTVSTTSFTPYDFKDNPAGTDYTYSDGNGNLTSDANKNLNTTYNFLNLPDVTSFTTTGDKISNVFDATGNKLMTVTSTASGTSVTDYIGCFQYKDNVQNMISNAEGYAHRDATGLSYFTYVKDHLGNVRNVLKAIGTTDPPMQYFASHELSLAAMERVVFQDLDSVRDFKPLSPGPQDQYAAQLDGAYPNKTIGTAILLNVMAGDRFDLAAQTYYDGNAQQMATVAPSQLLNAIVSTLSGGIVGNSQEGNASQIIPSIFTPANYIGVYDSIISSNTDSSLPQAYLNYVAFDENFNIVPENSGAIQIGATANIWNVIGTTAPITITRNGYFAAYISTRIAGMPVFFDGIGITHYSGGLVQENQYYPYGLPINVAQTDPTNKYLYQTKELNTTDDLYLSDFGARQYDAQLGRFTSLDPMSQFMSGYIGMGNHPTQSIDPTGMWDGDGGDGGDGGDDVYSSHSTSGGDGGIPNFNKNGSDLTGLDAAYGGYGGNDVENASETPVPSASETPKGDVLRTFTQNQPLGNIPVNYSYYANAITHNVDGDISATLPVIEVNGARNYLLDEDPNVLKAYSPFIPDATGIQLNGNFTMVAGMSWSLGIGEVGNHFGVWGTFGPSIGTPDASVGLSFIMAEHEGAGPIDPHSWSGTGTQMNGSLMFFNGSYGQGFDSHGHSVWSIYGAGVTIGAHDFYPIPVGYQTTPVTQTWSWFVN